MFSLPSVRLGRLFGIPLEVNVSWFIIFGLLALSLSFTTLPPLTGVDDPVLNVAIGVLTALLFFSSVILHEMSHSLVARAGGIRIAKITLFIFGGLAHMDEEPRKPGHEFVMAIAGPAMSLLIAAVLFVLYTLLSRFGVSPAFTSPLMYLSFMNLSVGVFNLFPGFPLDGGRVLRALLWGITGDQLKATKWASWAGKGLGYTMIAIALVGAVRFDAGFLWFALLGWFIASLAGSAYAQQVVMSRVSAIPVRQVMSSPVATAPCEITIGDMVQRYFLGERHSRYPVTCEGRLLGLVDLRAVKSVPQERWESMTVADVAHRDLERMIVSPDEPIDHAMARLTAESPGALLVVEEGRLAGIVTRSDVVRVLRANGR